MQFFQVKNYKKAQDLNPAAEISKNSRKAPRNGHPNPSGINRQRPTVPQRHDLWDKKQKNTRQPGAKLQDSHTRRPLYNL